MSGLDVAAGVTGLILFSLKSLKTCVAGLELISKARNFGTFADRLRAQLDWEKHMLEEWYERISPVENDPISPRRQLDWTRIRDLLAQLEALLTDVEKLEKVYKFKLEDSDAALIGQAVPPDSDAVTLLSKIKRRFKPDLKTLTAKHIHGQSNLWLKSKFAVSGETKIQQLVEEVTVFVDKIWDCLRDDDRAFLVRGMQFLLRQAVTQTSSMDGMKGLQPYFQQAVPNHTSPEIIRTIDVAKKLKETRLKLAFDLSNSEEGSNSANPVVKVPRSIRLKSGDLIVEQELSTSRALGKYEMKSVLVEWKPYERSIEDKLKPRIEALAILLSGAKDVSISSLPFLGFFQDHGSDRFAFVFEIQPAPSAAPSSGSDSILTLHKRFSQTKPPFDERLNIAIYLARTIRQFHTAGWLHKRIRSENLLFAHSPLQGPYLANFGYARVANLTEFSEPDYNPKQFLSQMLYTHKASLAGSSFRKCFDVFSMGLVLLEIGLWQDLRDILPNKLEQRAQPASTVPGEAGPALAAIRDESLLASGPDSIQARLREECPAFYSWAVTRCLDVAVMTDFDELESSIELQNSVVEDLERNC